MSASPAGNEVRDDNPPIQSGDELAQDNAPIELPVEPHPLSRFKPLLLPALIAMAIIGGLLYAGIPFLNALTKTDEKFQKIREDGVKAYSRKYQGF
jgi:hypothetical protein